MYVNKRREPTTDTQLTRRAVPWPNSHVHDERWRVVRALREMTAQESGDCERAEQVGRRGRLADIFPCLGIFVTSRSSFSMGHGAEWGTRAASRTWAA